MKREHVKAFVLGLLVMLLLVTSVGVFASSRIKKTVDIYYNNIKLVLDGKEVDLRDANGKKVDPFIYDGTTYLPVRGVAEAMGKKVEWEESTQTVYLGDKAQVNVEPKKEIETVELEDNWKMMTEDFVPGIENIEVVKLNFPQTINIAGQEFQSGYSTILKNKEASLVFNVFENYSELNFSYGFIDSGSQEDGVIDVYGGSWGNTLIKTIKVGKNDPVKSVVIDASGSSRMRIKLRETSSGHRMAIVNPKLKLK